MRSTIRVVVFLLIASLGGIEASAEQHPILGRKLVLRAPGGEESRRAIIVARDATADVPAIVGDPTVNGARLHLLANGWNGTHQVIILPAPGWRTIRNGFRFVHTGLGVPIQSLLLRVAPSGKASLRVDARGNIPGQSPSLALIPPNPGTDAAVVLEIPDGDTYCTWFGEAAGGTVLQNTAETFKMRSAAVEVACPFLLSPVCCQFAGHCTWAAVPGNCVAGGGSPGPTYSVCSSASGTCEPAPADPGECCWMATSVGSPCTAGPGLATLCPLSGGGFVANGVCTPTGCASPSGAFLDAVPAP